MPVELKRHHWAKQLTLKVVGGTKVVVTMPRRTPYKMAELFAHSKSSWIKKQLATAGETYHQGGRTPQQGTAQQRREARKLVEEKLEYWNEFYNLQWKSINIRNQSSRWGSASSRGTLSFNWRIVELPGELQDYLIVHELCHLQQPNHSPDFWALVSKSIPEYKTKAKELRYMDLNKV